MLSENLLKINLHTSSDKESIKKQFDLDNKILEEELLSEKKEKNEVPKEELKKYSESFSPYPFFLFWYIYWASDICITAFPDNEEDDRSHVSFNIDWIWSDEFFIEKELHNQYINAIKNWAIKWSWNAKTENQKIPQDWKGVLYIINKDKKIDKRIQLRLAFAPQHITDSRNTPLEECVIRLLDNKWNLPLEKAGFNIFDYHKLKKLQSFKKWLILISWPTWSWKSSTLFWYIDKVNNRTKHIITLENPVEFDVPWITQMDIIPNEDIPDTDEVTMNFTRMEQYLMRAAPNVILMWEIRSYHTAKSASNLAWTWHVVLGTLHTNSAIQTLDRLMWFKSKTGDWLDQNAIIENLEYVSAQMLSPRLCPHCKIKVKNLKQVIDSEKDILIKDLYKEEYENILTQKKLVIKYMTKSNVVKILWSKFTSLENIEKLIEESYIKSFYWCDKCNERKKRSDWTYLPPNDRVWIKWRRMINESIWFDSYISKLALDPNTTKNDILSNLLDIRPKLKQWEYWAIVDKEQHFTTLYQDWLFKALLSQNAIDKIIPWTDSQEISILDAKKFWYKEL